MAVVEFLYTKLLKKQTNSNIAPSKNIQGKKAYTHTSAKKDNTSVSTINSPMCDPGARVNISEFQLILIYNVINHT